MPLTDEDMARIIRTLDECDAALHDKPRLASVFNREWRARFLEQTRRVERANLVGYPTSYFVPVLRLYFPPDYQDRLEQGLGALLPKLGGAEQAHLLHRMRYGNGLSAEEELLLARGFAEEFGSDSISFPVTPANADKPEFLVAVDGVRIEIEAKGLIDCREIRELNEAALRFGDGSWVAPGPIDEDRRVRQQAAKKLLSPESANTRVLVFVQYTPWIDIGCTATLLRDMATAPDAFGIPQAHHPLAIALVGARWIAGVWFNQDRSESERVDGSVRERLRRSLRGSFYARQDGIFFEESDDPETHRQKVMGIYRSRHGG